MRIVVPYGMGETKRRLRRGMRVESEPVLFALAMSLMGWGLSCAIYAQDKTAVVGYLK